MAKRIFRIFLLICGFALGYQLVSTSIGTISTFAGLEETVATSIGVSILADPFAALFLILSARCWSSARHVNNWIETTLNPYQPRILQSV